MGCRGELSIAASTLYRLASEQSNDPVRQFDAWMARQGFTNDAASKALGLPKREVDYYRKGKNQLWLYIYDYKNISFHFLPI